MKSIAFKRSSESTMIAHSDSSNGADFFGKVACGVIAFVADKRSIIMFIACCGRIGIARNHPTAQYERDEH